ncbi:hypothetical protein ABPG74_019957 [Tetrahymena malaccensis]
MIFNKLSLQFYYSQFEQNFRKQEFERRYLELRLLLLLLISNDIYTLIQYEYNLFLICTCIYYPVNWFIVYKFPQSIYYLNPLTQIVVAYTSLYKMTIFTQNVARNQVLFHYLMYGQVSAIAFYILKSSNFLLNFCGAIGAEIIYFYGYSFSFFFSRILTVIVFYTFQDYIVCKSERMSFYLKQKEIEWRSIISKVLPMKVFISEFDFLTCNLKLYDCSREAQHYVKDKNASYQFMDILSKINLDMRSSILFQQNNENKKSKNNSKSKKANINHNKQKEENEEGKILNQIKEKTFQQIQNDNENNLIDLKTYLLHRHISIEKDQKKESANQIKFNILNPFQNKKKTQNMSDQEEYKTQNPQNNSNQDKIYQSKQIDVQNLYKMDSLTGYYFQEDEKTASEKLKIKIAYYQLYKPLLVVYFEDQTIQNEYINIKEEKQRFDVLFIEILESFRIQITQILKLGLDSNMLKSAKNRLLLLLNNLYIIFDYYMLSQVKKNGILNLQIQSQELNIKRNSFSIQDTFKEIKDIYQEAVVIKIQDSIKNKIIFNDIRRLKQILFATISSMIRMCSKSQINIEVNSDQEKRELWKGVKFTINGIKDIHIKESKILDYFSFDNCNQLNDLTLYVLNNVTKIIGPFNFKSFCSPQDEIIFEFTIFEDIKQVYSEQLQSMFQLQTNKNSPTLAPCLSSKFNQTLINSQEDMTKTSIASPSDLRQRAVSNNIHVNQFNQGQQDQQKLNENKLPCNVFNTANKLRKLNTINTFSTNNQNVNNQSQQSEKVIKKQLYHNEEQNIDASYQSNSQQINDSDLSEYQNSFQSQLSKSIKTLPNKLRKMKSFNLNEEILKKKKNSINMELDLQTPNKQKSPNDSGEIYQPNTRMSIFSKNQVFTRGISYSHTNKPETKQFNNKQFSDSSIQNQIQDQSQIDHQQIVDYLNDESKHEYFLSSKQIMNNLQKQCNDQSYQQQKFQQKVILDINSQESDSEKSQKMDQFNLEDSQKNNLKNALNYFSSETLNEEANQVDIQQIKNFIYSQNFKTLTNNQLINQIHFNYKNKPALNNQNILEQS